MGGGGLVAEAGGGGYLANKAMEGAGGVGGVLAAGVRGRGGVF